MKKYMVYIVFLSMLEIALALYLTEWRNTFWTYVEQRNFHGFCIQICIFTVAAVIFCLINSYSSYFMTLCAIKWREILNAKAVLVISKAENLGQRIQEDCKSYPDLFLGLVFGLGKSIVYILVFSVSLAINFNLIYLGIIIIYASVSTIVARRIAEPLIKLNYTTQQAEATYRNEITSINFSNCIQIMTGMAIKTKRLAYFQTFYGQIAVVLPIIIASPAYFNGALTLGALMQVTGTMGTITDNLSFGITSFNLINKFKSCQKRLREIEVI